MDIQSTAATSNQNVATAGRAGSLESAAEERKTVEDSAVERKEAEPSAKAPGVGERVDVQA
ncbi:hypothetical protein [Gimibacter soli]|uniref:Uncharacterized protein n=1 Tax=Gimibacter soli TaxID=3024400 RepID=A0AAF0BKZ4_9PROT|nr:hypothetical protein [Gimibacter soli]WCL52845.1 hypothetical protein PH603_09865 [Gimibacter soli]